MIYKASTTPLPLTGTFPPLCIPLEILDTSNSNSPLPLGNAQIPHLPMHGRQSNALGLSRGGNGGNIVPCDLTMS